MLGKTMAVPFFKTDISSSHSTEAAFSAPWPPSVAHLPLTVFHTAAVIVPSERSYLFYSFCEKVNVHGTRHVLESARRAGADVLISTTSGSIAIHPVQYWVSPWRLLFGGREGSFPVGYWQMLDERDFFRPLRDMDEFFALYPASKAIAERAVCEANSEGLRTGSIRPANGVYGNPTDNTVGGPLGRGVSPEYAHFPTSNQPLS
jgi:nucleoside-diphosphate-sugar epimerase